MRQTIAILFGVDDTGEHNPAVAHGYVHVGDGQSVDDRRADVLRDARVGACELTGEVGTRDDLHNPAPIDDRQPVDVAIAHQPERTVVGHRGLGRDDGARHQISGGQRICPCLSYGTPPEAMKERHALVEPALLLDDV
jgi:hypothetical protein